ncbi:MAG TPA: OsmC family protein [Thermoplasmata archaeon]|nr:OsmC family protein [Thermoplasmata archaeon]
MQAVATWRKGHEILLEDGRAHSVVVDFPPEGGGTSAGTTPLELSVLSLAGSIALTFVTLARKRRLDFSGVTLVLEGEASAGDTGLRAIHGTLRVRSRAERTEVDALLQTALEQSPVGRLFREAHVPINVVTAVSSAGRPA